MGTESRPCCHIPSITHHTVLDKPLRTPEEFEARLSDIYLDIALDGQILYDTDGYAAQRLAEVRNIIDQAGLYREHTPQGDIWNWRTLPTKPWSIDWKR